MERQRFVAALIAVLAFAWAGQGSAQAQGPEGGGPRFHNGKARQFRAARERWRQMSPDERQRIQGNAARWMGLPPEERRQLRVREGMRRQQIRQEAEAAMQNSGLQLEAEKREMYERRYIQERRRIERTIRQEMEEKRQRELAPVMENLKKEFAQPQPSANPSAGAAAASPSPTK